MQSVKFTHWAYSSLNHHLAPEERDNASFFTGSPIAVPKNCYKTYSNVGLLWIITKKCTDQQAHNYTAKRQKPSKSVKQVENACLIQKTHDIQVTVLCRQIQRPVTNTALQQMTADTSYEFNHVCISAKEVHLLITTPGEHSWL